MLLNTKPHLLGLLWGGGRRPGALLRLLAGVLRDEDSAPEGGVAGGGGPLGVEQQSGGRGSGGEGSIRYQSGSERKAIGI